MCVCVRGREGGGGVVLIGLRSEKPPEQGILLYKQVQYVTNTF